MAQLLLKYDVWHIIGTYPAGYAALGLRNSAPTILKADGVDIQKNEEYKYGSRLNTQTENIIKKALLNTDKLVAISPTVEKCFLDLGVEPEKILSIPNGVDINLFTMPWARLFVNVAFQGLRLVACLCSKGCIERCSSTIQVQKKKTLSLVRNDFLIITLRSNFHQGS